MEKSGVCLLRSHGETERNFAVYIIEKKYQKAIFCLIDNLYPYRYTECRNKFTEAL